MQLKEILRSNSDNIVKLLEFYNYKNITIKNNEIRAGLDESSNRTSLSVKLDENLTSSNFANNVSGDIITVIMEDRGVTYRDIVETIRCLFNVEIEKKRTFNKDFSISKLLEGLVLEEEILDIYDETVLDFYKKNWNTRFLRDGIDINTQVKFGLMYDTKSNRILIPHRNITGDLVGLIGRINRDNFGDMSKYYPLIPYPKKLNLYGCYENYKSLTESEVIYVGESEKFVMQLDSMNINNAVSLCGYSISAEQIDILISFKPKVVVFCFDEGLDDEKIFRTVNKFYFIAERFGIKTGVMMDKGNKYIKKGSCMSPTDSGKECWKNMVEKCVEII